MQFIGHLSPTTFSLQFHVGVSRDVRQIDLIVGTLLSTCIRFGMFISHTMSNQPALVFRYPSVIGFQLRSHPIWLIFLNLCNFWLAMCALFIHGFYLKPVVFGWCGCWKCLNSKLVIFV